MPTLGPLFVRAVFHDCFSATRSVNGSGCNGSLRDVRELQDRRNHGLLAVIDVVLPVSAATCVSVADLIVYGSTAGVYRAGGPFIAPRFGRRDAELGTIDNARHLPTGSGPGDPMRAVLKSYSAQGFKHPREVVASIVGGHAIGGRIVERTPAGNRREHFTPNPARFDAAYARHLMMVEQRTNGKAGSGFHPLESDLALLRNLDMRPWVVFYSNSSKVCRRKICRNGNIVTWGDLHLYRDFGRFMTKLGGMVVDENFA